MDLATQANESKTVSNTASEYVSVFPSFKPTPAMDASMCEAPYGSEVYQYFNNETTGGFKFKFFGPENPDYYVGRYADFPCSFDAHSFVYPVGFEYSQYNGDMGEWVEAGIVGAPITFCDDELCYYNVYNEYFSLKAPGSKWIFGSASPVTYAPAVAFNGGLKRKVVMMFPDFIGQFGENFTIDLPYVDLSVVHDGTTVCSSIADYEEWCYTFADDSHASGVVTTTFTNDNIVVGTVPGRVVAEMSYNENSTDLCPPVLQMLRFSSPLGLYGPSFRNNLVQMRFSAGDMNDNGYKTEYKQADVKVEYAPHGTGDYEEMEYEIEKELEGDQLPVYLVPMTTVDRKSVDGWFDFRFTVTDEAGNVTVETFEPAVCFLNLVGTSGLDAVDVSFDDTVTVYSTLGVCLMADAPREELERLPAGVYIVNGQKYLRK